MCTAAVLRGIVRTGDELIEQPERVGGLLCYHPVQLRDILRGAVQRLDPAVPVPLRGCEALVVAVLALDRERRVVVRARRDVQDLREQ